MKGKRPGSLSNHSQIVIPESPPETSADIESEEKDTSEKKNVIEGKQLSAKERFAMASLIAKPSTQAKQLLPSSSSSLLSSAKKKESQSLPPQQKSTKNEESNEIKISVLPKRDPRDKSLLEAKKKKFFSEFPVLHTKRMTIKGKLTVEESFFNISKSDAPEYNISEDEEEEEDDDDDDDEKVDNGKLSGSKLQNEEENQNDLKRNRSESDNAQRSKKRAKRHDGISDNFVRTNLKRRWKPKKRMRR